MQKIMERWWMVGIVGMLMALFAYGLQNMYFHQDDLDWFILANRPLAQVMSAPIGDHINYLWRLLLSIEWRLFGFYFPGYLAVSIAIHSLVIWLMYLIAKETSGREDLAIIPALLFSVNTNWTETVLWISGQTISITALFVLIAVRQLWRRRGEVVGIALACATSALALGLPLATLLVYKKQRWAMAIVLVLVVVTYFWRGGDGTSVAMSVEWAWQVFVVWGLMIINSVVGRLFIPFDRLEMMRIVVVTLLVVYGSWKWRRRLGEIWSDAWSRFLLCQLGFYYLIVALGRAQYGIGIMRSERYSYIGLVLLLLLAARILRKVQIGRWVWTLPLVVLIQCFGLYHRATSYVVRPQQLRGLVEQVRMNPSGVDPNAYLPYHVLHDERLRYRDLIDLIHD